MAVTEQGEDWWRGTDARDLDAYLVEYSTAAGDPVSRVVHAVCALCGNGVFSVIVDDDAGVVGRTCLRCGDSRWMVDGAEHAAGARLGDAQCLCGAETFDVAAGFSLLDDGELRSVYVALRCLACGLLGVYADWVVDCSPSDHLLALV